MSRLGYYWKRTARTMKWVIAYRNRTTDILQDQNTSFVPFRLDKGFWGADPFVIDVEGSTFLFLELFVEKENKGVIAVSEYNGQEFEEPRIVIDEPYHLSFPCVFFANNKYYMVPESGSQHNIVLYECKSFPYEWKKKKVLLTDFNSSDTIVHIDKETNDIFVIASQLVDSTCIARNILYKLDINNLSLIEISQGSVVSEKGIRNAGLIFESNGMLVRPGQNCPKGEYGKSTIFWKVAPGNLMMEDEILEISVEDIKIAEREKYSGVHTYNISHRLEVIDLRSVTCTPLAVRVKLFVHTIFDYIKMKLR